MLNSLYLRLFIICFSSWTSFAFASSHIQLTINAFYGVPCAIVIPKDYLTNTFQTLAEGKINETGMVEFNLELNCPVLAYFKVEQRKVPFYLLPNQDLNITLKGPKQADVLMDPIRIKSITENNKNTFSINRHKARLDSVMADFYVTVPDIMRSTMLAGKIDSAVHSIDTTFTEEAKENDFFASELQYTLAQLYLLNRRGHELVYLKYFKDEKVRFDSPAYFETFKIVTKGKSQDFIRKHDRAMLACEKEFNTLACITAIQDSSFPNTTFNQLMLLHYFQPSNHDERFSSGFRYGFVNDLCQAKTPFVSGIALNWLKSNKKLGVGDQAPHLPFTLASGEDISLKNENKFTYLIFFETDDDLFQKHLLILEKFAKEYKNYVQFIAVSMDRNESNFEIFAQDHKIKLVEFAWFNHHWDTLEEYQVIGSPTYFLIQTDGRFLRMPAPTPEQISDDLIEIKKALKTGAHDGFHFIQH